MNEHSDIPSEVSPVPKRKRAPRARKGKPAVSEPIPIPTPAPVPVPLPQEPAENPFRTSRKDHGSGTYIKSRFREQQVQVAIEAVMRCKKVPKEQLDQIISKSASLCLAAKKKRVTEAMVEWAIAH